MFRVVTILGTRPEAVKLAPIILGLRRHPDRLTSLVCITGQHRQMLDQGLALFDIQPDVDLAVMAPGQTLPDLTARIVVQAAAALTRLRPDLVLVQGDTTTVMAAALAAFYQQIPVGHVEAGLRSYDRYSPFPEEINRRLTGVLSTYHFAPTERARQALLREGTPDSQIVVTGNPVIDALQLIRRRPRPPQAQAILEQAGVLNGQARRLILVTAHRRENFGPRLESICQGLATLAARNEDVVVVYPVHLNPQVEEIVYARLGGCERVLLLKPLAYDVMTHLMEAAYLVLTDSGGLQEEAPALGKPVLVLRTETERPEGVAAGTARLIGPWAEGIVAETERLLRDPQAYANMAQATSPYGDGRAAERIVDFVLRLATERPVETSASSVGPLTSSSFASQDAYPL